MIWKEYLSQDVTQYPLHNVAYAPTKFEVTTSKGGGVDAFWGQGHMRGCICIMLPMHLQSLKLLCPKVEEMHLKKIQYFDL